MEEKEEEISKNIQPREVILDRRKIARMKERRACIILGKLFSRSDVRDSFPLTDSLQDTRAQSSEVNQIKLSKRYKPSSYNCIVD